MLKGAGPVFTRACSDWSEPVEGIQGLVLIGHLLGFHQVEIAVAEESPDGCKIQQIFISILSFGMAQETLHFLLFFFLPFGVAVIVGLSATHDGASVLVNLVLVVVKTGDLLYFSGYKSIYVPFFY